jgi:hypothetical protein
MSYNTLFDKNAPRELELLLDTTYDVYEHFKTRKFKVKPSEGKYTKWWNEYGFYFENNESNADVFLGLWFSIWVDHGRPLCFSLNWKSHYPKGELLERRFKDFFEVNSKVFDKYLVYEEYPTMCFSLDFLNSLESEVPLIIIFEDLMSHLGLSTSGLIMPK